MPSAAIIPTFSRDFSCGMHTPRLIALAISLIGLMTPVQAWDQTDRQSYNNKMTLLQVLLDGAKQRASNTGDLETLCMLMSIGNDVTTRYTQLNPEDLQVQDRLSAMRNDLSLCLALLDEPLSL